MVGDSSRSASGVTSAHDTPFPYNSLPLSPGLEAGGATFQFLSVFLAMDQGGLCPMLTYVFVLGVPGPRATGQQGPNPTEMQGLERGGKVLDSQAGLGRRRAI